MKDEKQNINCNVHDCTHCACEENKCVLHEIKVCSCSPEEKKEATMCNSYKKRDAE